MFSASAIIYVGPVVLITLFAMVLLLLEAFLQLSPRAASILALGAIGITAYVTIAISVDPDSMGDGSTHGMFWGGMCRWDGSAKFFDLFFLAVAALVIWMGDEVQAHPTHGAGEFAILPLFTTAGLMLLASANDFMLLFVAL